MRSCCEQTMHSTIHGEDIVPCSHCPPPAYHHESRPAINDALFITVILVEPCSYRPAGIWTCLILGKPVWTQSRRFFSSSHVTLQCFVKTQFETIDKAGDISPGRSRSWTSSCCGGATWCPGATPCYTWTGKSNRSVPGHHKKTLHFTWKQQQDMAKKTIVFLTACKNCSSRANHFFFNP